MKKKKKKKQTRNWHAVNAHFRKSGAIKDKKKEINKKKCRKIKELEKDTK